MIDFWEIAKNFKTGDVVQRFLPFAQGDALSPFVGKVLVSHPGLGVVDVQWPHGHQRISADEIVLVNPKITKYLPLNLDQAYSTYDMSKIAAWKLDRVPGEFLGDLSQLWSNKKSDLDSYDVLWRKYSNFVDDLTIKSLTLKFYDVGRRMAKLRMASHIRKNAAYWVAQGRQYRATKEEIQSKRFLCPKCGTLMKNATYRMEKGTRVRLLACPKDLFLIERTSMLDPDGKALVW